MPSSYGAKDTPVAQRLKLEKRIIPAANPTICSHPGRPSQGCIAQHFVHRSHAWHLQLRNAKKSASPKRCQIPSSFYSKSDRFGDFLASGWFESIRGDFGTWPPDLGAKSAGPERCRIPLHFLLKKWSIWRLLGLRVVPRLSKRFRDLSSGLTCSWFEIFWTSEWFESMLKPPELWNHRKTSEKPGNIDVFFIKTI